MWLRKPRQRDCSSRLKQLLAMMWKKKMRKRLPGLRASLSIAAKAWEELDDFLKPICDQTYYTLLTQITFWAPARVHFYKKNYLLYGHDTIQFFP